MQQHPYATTQLPCLSLMCVLAEQFPQDVVTAFARLQNALPSFRGRRCYGISQCIDGQIQYRAAVLPLIEQEFELYQLEKIILPAGYYATASLYRWHSNPQQIGATFAHMEQYFTPQPHRSYIEHYLSDERVDLYLPIAADINPTNPMH